MSGAENLQVVHGLLHFDGMHARGKRLKIEFDAGELLFLKINHFVDVYNYLSGSDAAISEFLPFSPLVQGGFTASKHLRDQGERTPSNGDWVANLSRFHCASFHLMIYWR